MIILNFILLMGCYKNSFYNHNNYKTSSQYDTIDLLSKKSLEEKILEFRDNLKSQKATEKEAKKFLKWMKGENLLKEPFDILEGYTLREHFAETGIGNYLNIVGIIDSIISLNNNIEEDSLGDRRESSSVNPVPTFSDDLDKRETSLTSTNIFDTVKNGNLEQFKDFLRNSNLKLDIERTNKIIDYLFRLLKVKLQDYIRMKSHSEFYSSHSLVDIENIIIVYTQMLEILIKQPDFNINRIYINDISFLLSLTMYYRYHCCIKDLYMEIILKSNELYLLNRDNVKKLTEYLIIYIDDIEELKYLILNFLFNLKGYKNIDLFEILNSICEKGHHHIDRKILQKIIYELSITKTLLNNMQNQEKFNEIIDNLSKETDDIQLEILIYNILVNLSTAEEQNQFICLIKMSYIDMRVQESIIKRFNSRN